MATALLVYIRLSLFIAGLCSVCMFAGTSLAYTHPGTDGNTLILYYSRSGTTRAACEVLQKELGADMIEVKDRGNRGPGFGIAVGMFKTLLNLRTDTDPERVNLAPYRTIIIAAPIWAAKFGLAMRSFVERNSLDGKGVVIFITADSFIEEKYQKKHQELIKASGGTVRGYFQVQATDRVNGKKIPRAKETIVAETLKLIPEIKQALAGEQ